MNAIKSIIIIALLVFAAGCVMEETARSDRMSIVTTLYPLYEFSKAVGGDKVDVLLLLPPGTEPHTYEPKPSDIIKMANADIFVYIGEEMEPWAEDILKGVDNPGLIVIDSIQNIGMIGHREEMHEHEEEEPEHGEHDPHIWLDFENDNKIIAAITNALALKDPKDAEFYSNNAAVYIARLNALDNKFREGLSDCRHDTFITGGHSAFSYLAERYGLEQISVFGLSPDAEPSPKKIVEIIEIADDKALSYIFFEELVNPKTAEVIAEEIGAQTLVLNPAGSLTKEQMQEETFISVMEKNLESLRIGLECG